MKAVLRVKPEPCLRIRPLRLLEEVGPNGTSKVNCAVLEENYVLTSAPILVNLEQSGEYPTLCASEPERGDQTGCVWKLPLCAPKYRRRIQNATLTRPMSAGTSINGPRRECNHCWPAACSPDGGKLDTPEASRCSFLLRKRTAPERTIYFEDLAL
jgi:hypothetical protein